MHPTPPELGTMRRWVAAALTVAALVSALGSCSADDATGGSTDGGAAGERPELGAVTVEAGEELVIEHATVEGVTVQAGASLELHDVEVRGAVVVLPSREQPTTFHMHASSVHRGMTVNAVDPRGDIDWGPPFPVDIEVSDSHIHHPQGEGDDHTEALAGFGYMSGARFRGNTLTQAGPFNATATAVVNWYGHLTTFEGNELAWAGDEPAAHYTLYARGRGNVVSGNRLAKGLSGYVYPNGPDEPVATYAGNTDLASGAAIDLPGP